MARKRMAETQAISATPVRKRPSKVAIAFAGLLVAISMVVVGLEFRTDATNHDFISYWTTGKLLASHANPYDSAAILRIENSAGAHYQKPFVMRNPPWALFLVLPLGWCNIPVAGVLWTLSIIAAGLVSVRLLWPPSAGTIPLLAWFFAPLLMCVAAGQTGTFLLLGVSLFLYCERERRPFLAGLALLLPAMKPHLFLLFWPVLLLDCWRRREYRVLAGITTGLAVAIVFALCVDPRVWTHYLGMMRSEHADDQFLPNLSCGLRLLHPRAKWLQAIPTVVGLGLVLWQRARARAWGWQREGAMLFAWSIFTAPYSWPTDQAVFLPAVLAGSVRGTKTVTLSLLLLNVLEMVTAVRNSNLSAHAYLWTAPAWMVWCGWAYWRSGRTAAMSGPGLQSETRA